MKSRTVIWLIGISVFAALVFPIQSAAQGQTQHFRHYKLIDMGTFGGLSSTYPSLNNTGLTVGWSATFIPKLQSSHPFICGGTDGVGTTVTVAFQWQDGILTDLGALPGEHNCSIPSAVNANGEIVGASENGLFDSLTGINQSRAVLWIQDNIEDLGSLGGNQNTAFGINILLLGTIINAMPRLRVATRSHAGFRYVGRQ